MAAAIALAAATRRLDVVERLTELARAIEEGADGSPTDIIPHRALAIVTASGARWGGRDRARSRVAAQSVVGG